MLLLDKRYCAQKSSLAKLIAEIGAGLLYSENCSNEPPASNGQPRVGVLPITNLFFESIFGKE
jgi:hypothetical protein